MLGAFGHNLADSLFMPALLPGSQTTAPAPLLMEFYPSGSFLKDRELAMRTLGMRYMAWWDSRYAFSAIMDEPAINPTSCRKFSGASLPPVMGLRAGQGTWVTIDVPLVLEEIKAEARRFSS